MLWRKKVLCYTATFAGGFSSLAFAKHPQYSQYETIKEGSELSQDKSSFIYLPETSGNYFNEDSESQWCPLFQKNDYVYWKLLNLTKSKKRSVRHKAIKLLSDSTKLEKWEYMMIAQACGPSTAIALARSPNTHSSFFFPPPFRAYKVKNLNESILDLIDSLPYEDMDHSVKFLVMKAKKIAHRIENKKALNTVPEKSFEIYHSQRKLKDSIEFDKLCLQILLAQSTIKSCRSLMIKNGILKILWDILDHATSETEEEFQCLIARILANFALEEEFMNIFYTTGWIGILALWSRSSSIQVSLPANKALANLDFDDYHHSTYDSDVYLLHPISRCNDKELYADIVFVHGLHGATFWTWRQSDTMKKVERGSDKDLDRFDLLEKFSLKSFKFQSYTFCWPKDWLAIDFPNLRFLSVDYKTGNKNWKSLYFQQKENENLNTKAKQMMDKLMKAKVGEKPIIWVTHSLGGILVKQLLLEAAESKNIKANDIVKNTAGIIFLSVPHKGSELVSLINQIPQFFRPTVAFPQLHKGSSVLLSLHHKFKEIAQQNNIDVLSFGETKKSKWGLTLVSVDSSNPDIGEFYTLPVDHLNTCKPESCDTKVYIKIKEFLQVHIPTSVSFSQNYLECELSNIMCLIP